MRIITLSRKKIVLIFCLIFFAGLHSCFAQCPTVINSSQSFCDVQSPTVASLAATNNGNGVVWYATANSTTSLSNTVGLLNGEDYFADDNSGTCGARQRVVVTIYSAPTGQNFQGVCVDVASNATISNLIAAGNNVQWYSMSNGGSALPSSTVLIDNTIYYASQTNPSTGCETSRLSVFVNVGVVPVPQGNPIQSFCNDPSNQATIADLVASGTNKRWYLTSSSASPLPLTTPLINGQSYYATTVDPPCESITRFEVNVVLVEPNDAGTNGTRRICVSDLTSTPPFNLFNLLGGSPDNTGVWTGPIATSNGFQGTVNVAPLTLAGSPYTFSYTVSSMACATASSTVTIVVLPLPTVSIAANTTVCSGTTAIVTFSGTPNATVTYNINGGVNQTILLSNSGVATINNTYATTTTFNLISVASQGTPSCSQSQTGSITITVLPLPTVAISSNVTICTGSSAIITFTGTPNATAVYNVNGGSNQTIVLNSSGIATITNTYAATTVFALVSVTSSGTPACSQSQSGTATITVKPLPTVAISSNSTVCPNGSATVTFTGTPNATVSYTVNGGGTQTIVLTSSGIATITNIYNVNTTYSLVSIASSGIPVCSQPQSGSVTITVLPLPTATVAANATVCSGANATVTFTGTPNATVTYTINGGGNQTIVLSNSGTASYTNVYNTTTTISLVSVASSGTPSCSQSQSGSITITVLPLPTVSISSNASVCPNGTATVTFTGTPNATVAYNANGGPNQTIGLNASGIATITQTFAVTTIYNLISATSTGTPSCSQPQTGSITITVIPLPTVTISSNATVCPNGSATVNFSGTANATVTYNINGGPNQTILLNGVGAAAITQSYTATTIYTLVSAASAGTPSCSQSQSGTVTITVKPLPTVAITSSTTICTGASATITFTGTPNATVTYTINGAANQTILLNNLGTATITNTYNATTMYALVSVASSGTPSCSQSQTGTVTVTVVPPPSVSISSNISICSGAAATVTFTGTPDAIVTYTVNSGGNQTILLSGTGIATITNTYATTTVYNLVSIVSGGSPGCSQPQTGTITITVIPSPVVAISANTTICSGSAATVTFTGTANATITYTVNGGVNQTIILNGSGTATITNVYNASTTFALVSAATSGTPSCVQPQTGAVTITVVPLPTVSIASNATICSGSTATVTFTGTPNAIVSYSANPGGNQTIVLNGSGTATIVSTYTTTTTYTLVSVASSGTPGCSQPQTGSVTITVLPLPVAAIAANATICSGSNATVTFNGTPNATVTYTVNGGAEVTLLLDGSGTATITNSFLVTTTYTLVSVASAGTPSCSQPLNGSITLTVVPPPSVAISSNTTICSGASATVTFTGTPNATVVYNVDGGSDQNIILDNAGMATITNVYTATTIYNLISITTSGTPSCSAPQTGSVTVTVLPLPTVAITADVTICAGAMATITFNGTANATVTYMVNGAGNQTILLDGSGVATITNTYSSTTVYNLVSVATSGTPSCIQPQTGTVTVTVIPLPIVTLSSNTTICSGSSATVTFTGTPNATVTYIINGGSNNTIILDGLGNATITNTYTSSATFTLVDAVLVGTPSCSQSQTGSITITVEPVPSVLISSDVTICSGGAAAVTFTGTANAIVTFTINGAPNQTIVLNNLGTAAITATYTTTTIFSLVSITTTGTPGCSQPQMGTVTITVVPLPFVSITASPTACSGENITVTFTGTSNAVVTYNINNGANQTIVLDGSGIALLTGAYTLNTTFNLISIQSTDTPSCIKLLTDSITITINPLPTVTIAANSTICAGTNATVTFTGTPNSIVTYTINSGSNLTIPIGPSGVAVLNAAYSVTSIFNLVSITLANPPSCSQSQTGSITITVIQPPIAGSNAVLPLCGNSNPQDLFPLLGSAAQVGGTWSPALASGTGIFNPAVDTAGIYTYTVVGTPPCINDTASATVTVVPQTDAGNDGIAPLCSNANSVNLITFLGGTPQTGGVWTPSLPSGTGLFNPGTDAGGVYTYTITGVFPCVNDTATVTVNITPGPDAGISGSLTLCSNSAAQDLFLSLGGTPQVGGTWSPVLISGSGIFDPAVDPSGIYTYTFSGNQPCDDDTATVTVTVNPIPDAGLDGNAIFCSNYAPADLFLNLGGNPQLGGTWSPVLSSGTGVFNPLVDLAGTYTYSVGGNLCSTDSAFVSVTVFQSPNAGGLNATLSIDSCVTTNSVNLFTGLNGTQGSGVWNDDDNTGALTNNIFNPTLVGAGTYHFTYTVSGGISPCLTDTATVTVVVSPIPNAGTFTGVQSVCNAVGTFDLLSLLSGNQAGGVWTDSNGVVVSNPINIATFAANTYSYTYTITNTCGVDSEIVQLTILPNPVLNLPNITVSSPICKGQDAVVNFSNMTDGSYTLTFDLSVSNVFTGLSTTVNIVGGAGNLIINAADIPNIGITTITFVNIASASTSCSTIVADVSANFSVLPNSNLDDANLSIANLCAGSDATVLISSATGLADGNYEFSYTIPQATPPTGTTGTVTIASGSGQFTVPAIGVSAAGTYTLTINTITSLSLGCNNLNETATAIFQVFPIPDASGALLQVVNSCVNFSNTVGITGAINLPDGNYTINYQLSGDNAATATAIVTFVNGNASFTISATDLSNSGNTTVTITQITSGASQCGAVGTNFTPVTFTITELDSPMLNVKGSEFCATDNPTVADLSSNIINAGSNAIVWYDSFSGGTAYSDTDLLVAGNIYYAALVSNSSCESATRLPVTVDLTKCEDIIIPDGFSPNNDGINDEFVIKNLGINYPNFKLEIFNRYGNILYKGNVNTPNWAGTTTEGGIKLGDALLPVGVYFYILEYNNGILKPRQGRVYLSR